MRTIETKIIDSMIKTHPFSVVVYLILVFLGSSCKEKRETIPNKIVSPASMFANRLKQEDLEFSSRQGSLLGLDSDQVLIFKEGGSVILRNYGYDVSKYEGFYEIGENNTLRLNFKGADVKWPIMVILTKDGKFLLRRADGLTAPTPELENEKYYMDYWPFGETKK